MGRKGNSKRKPSQAKSKPVNTGGGSNNVSALVQGKDNQPARIGENEKEKPSPVTKKGQKKG